MRDQRFSFIRAAFLIVCLGSGFPASPVYAVDQEQSLVQQGKDAVGNGDDAKAIELLTQAIGLNPNDEEAYRYRAVAYGGKDNYDAAIADFGQIIRLDAKNTEAHEMRGSLLFVRHDYDAAIKDFDELIRLQPENAEAYDIRAIARFAKGDNAGALPDFDQAIRLNPKNADYFDGRGEIFGHDGNYERALADFSEAIRLNPQDEDAYNDRGTVYRKTEANEKSITDLVHASKLNPHDPDPYAQLALVYSTCSQPELRNGKKAVADAERACEESQWDVPAYVDVLASAYAEAGDFENAIKCENSFLKTPKLDAKTASEARVRLALYLKHKRFPFGGNKLERPPEIRHERASPAALV